MEPIENREVLSLVIDEGIFAIAGNAQHPRMEHTVVLYDIAQVLNVLRSKYAHTPRSY